MATQTGSIDLKAQKEAHDKAAKVASDYITEIDSDGILVHDADYDGTTATKTGWHIGSVLEFLRQGVARFWIGLKNVGDSSPTVRIGKATGESHMELDYHSLQLIDKEGTTYFHVSDLRDAEGYLTETFTGDGSTTEFTVMRPVIAVDTVKVNSYPNQNYTLSGQKFTLEVTPASGAEVSIRYIPDQNTKAYTIGQRLSTGRIGPMSLAEGYLTTASNFADHSEGGRTTANGGYSHAEGSGTTASGAYSHVEGLNAIASGLASHAEGSGKATGAHSHAEGSGEATGAYSHAESGGETIGVSSHAENAGKADGDYSHAEGVGFASDDYSHAEGFWTFANAYCSHSQNENTKASKQSQTALGTFNEEDTSSTTTHPSGISSYGKYAAIIGNGTSDSARSNALAVRWDGLVDQAGRTAYPLFVYDTKPANSDPPILPCFVLVKSDYGLWYYD